MLSLSGCKTANAEKTSVVFNFPVHWPSFSLSDGMKAQTKNLLHWSSVISLGREKKKKSLKKKKHRGFFSFKIAKSKSKLQNQNYTHENT